MQKANIINLIKFFVEKNNEHFIEESHKIANDFDKNGDKQIAEYIRTMITGNDVLIPQSFNDEYMFLKKCYFFNNVKNLLLPKATKDSIYGVINAIKNNKLNKFIFYGQSGTGKTESVKLISNILKKDLYIVEFGALIDSKLGQTQKNIISLFDEINKQSLKSEIIVLFDEIDTIVMNRVSSNDLREMGRVTSTFLNCLDNLHNYITIIATTNLIDQFDRALLRRFDLKINFDTYSKDDLFEIAQAIYKFYLNNDLQKYETSKKINSLFRKIIYSMNPILSPGELKNAIKSSIFCSDSNDKYEHFRRLYKSISNNNEISIQQLKRLNFNVREMEILTNISKSKICRLLNKKQHEQ